MNGINVNRYFFGKHTASEKNRVLSELDYDGIMELSEASAARMIRKAGSRMRAPGHPVTHSLDISGGPACILGYLLGSQGGMAMVEPVSADLESGRVSVTFIAQIGASISESRVSVPYTDLVSGRKPVLRFRCLDGHSVPAKMRTARMTLPDGECIMTVAEIIRRYIR